MNAPWNVVGLFCEDVREEKSGQYTVLGIMPDNMSVPSMPGAIPKLGLYVRCHIDPKADVGAVSLKLKFPDGEETTLSAFDEASVKKIQTDTLEKGTPVAGLVLVAVLAMLRLSSPGRMLATVSIGGQEIVAAGINFEVTQPKLASTSSPLPV